MLWDGVGFFKGPHIFASVVGGFMITERVCSQPLQQGNRIETIGHYAPRTEPGLSNHILFGDSKPGIHFSIFY